MEKRSFQLLLAALVLLASCQRGSDLKTVRMNTIKTECRVLPGESFDTSFLFYSESYRLRCTTLCTDDATISDTVNDSVVRLYPDRYFRFSLHTPARDTGFYVTRKLIRKDYPFPQVYEKSVLAFPRFQRTDPEGKVFEIHAFFMYPRDLEGSDVHDDIIFCITPGGKVILKSIIPYQAPQTDQ